VNRFRSGARALTAVALIVVFGAGCGASGGQKSRGAASLTRPFSAPEVTAAFARHHLKVEVFARATNCPPVCTTATGIPLAATELQYTESRHAFVFDVLLYRTEADATRVISLTSSQRQGSDARTDSLSPTWQRRRHVRRGHEQGVPGNPAALRRAGRQTKRYSSGTRKSHPGDIDRRNASFPPKATCLHQRPLAWQS
jgi:hypothetical protein